MNKIWDNDKVSKLIHGILIITPIVFMPWMSDRFYYPKILFVYIMIAIIAYVLFFNRNRQNIILSREEKLILIYLSFVFLSVFFSSDKSRAIWGSLGREEGIIAISAYAILFIISRKYFKVNETLVKIIKVTSIIVAIYGILQFYNIDPIPRDYLRVAWRGRAFSTMGNPNFLGSYLVLILPIPVYSFIKENRIGELVVSSILYYCLLLTFTRSALIGFIIIILMVVVYTIKNKNIWNRAFFLLLLTFLLITVFANNQSNGRIFGRFQSIGTDFNKLIEKEDGYEKAGANRIYIWTRTIELIKEKPLIGYGLDNLDTVFLDKYSDEMERMFNQIYMVDRAHNEYLHIAVSSGIPALITYLIFIILCLKKGYDLTRRDIRYLPYFTAVSAYLVQAFFNISVVSVAYIFWIFLGIITNDDVFEHESYPFNTSKSL